MLIFIIYIHSPSITYLAKNTLTWLVLISARQKCFIFSIGWCVYLFAWIFRELVNSLLSLNVKGLKRCQAFISGIGDCQYLLSLSGIVMSFFHFQVLSLPILFENFRRVPWHWSWSVEVFKVCREEEREAWIQKVYFRQFYAYLNDFHWSKVLCFLRVRSDELTYQ